MLSVTNFVPGGHGFFAYQAAEFDLRGPANGTAAAGLSYFLTNVRVSPAARLELQGTYNRGHSLDARRLTEDVLNDRPLTPQAIEGLRYESAGGRVTVQVARQAYLYAGWARDRNNRDDAPTGRVTVGAHAGNLFGSGFDVSGSDALIDLPVGPRTETDLLIARTIVIGLTVLAFAIVAAQRTRA